MKTEEMIRESNSVIGCNYHKKFLSFLYDVIDGNEKTQGSPVIFGLYEENEEE